MREPPAISEDYLRACVQAQYGLTPATVEFLPLGWDTNAGVYRIVDEQDVVYLLKVTTRTLYEPGYLVPRYLRDQGIAAVVAPLPTVSDHALWTQLDGWRLVVYPFIAGDTGWTTMTDDQWRLVGAIVRQIHRVAPPTVERASLHSESFDPSGYAQWIRAFGVQPAPTPSAGGAAAATLRAAWQARQSSIDAVVAALEALAGALRSRPLPCVICHADLHPANLIRDPAGAMHVIDWDEVMLAPKERDFLFVGDPPAESASLSDAAPFFQGYGPSEIDWPALTYFRYERVAQDVIAFAQDVCFRDDMGEATKAEAVELFQGMWAPGGQLEAATRAAAHLTAELDDLINGSAN